jgi:hypothetical protein
VLHAPHNEKARMGLREQALNSTYFMAKAVIGFGDLTDSLHGDMCAWIDHSTRTRKLGLVPRDHLKTSIWTIANSIVRVARDPNIRILLGNETATNAQHFLRRIEAIFERNDTFQWLFPELIPDFTKVKKWSESEMLIPRTEDFPESTIETIGVGGAVVSRHYKLIKLDDLVGKEASESAEVMKKTIDWYQYCESLLEQPIDGIEVFGTRWAHNDLYSWMEHNEDEWLDIFFRTVWGQQTGLPIWPERFPASELARIRKKIGAFKFSCQYENRPFDPEGGSFRPEWLRYYKQHLDGIVMGREDGKLNIVYPSQFRTFMRVDPAISEKRGAARTGVIVDGMWNDGRVFVFETWAKRCDVLEMIDKLFEFQEMYNCEAVGIEAVAYQRVLKPIIERECIRRNIWLNVVDLKPDTREKKENRIRGAVTPYAKAGLIWVNEEKHGDFIEEFVQFPNGSTVDVLDAFAYGPIMWGEPAEEVDEAREEYEFEEERNEVTGY